MVVISRLLLSFMLVLGMVDYLLDASIQDMLFSMELILGMGFFYIGECINKNR